MEAAKSQIGLEDMQDAIDDAKSLVGMFKTGISRGQTQIKISIGESCWCANELFAS